MQSLASHMHPELLYFFYQLGQAARIRRLLQEVNVRHMSCISTPTAAEPPSPDASNPTIPHIQQQPLLECILTLGCLIALYHTQMGVVSSYIKEAQRGTFRTASRAKGLVEYEGYEERIKVRQPQAWNAR